MASGFRISSTRVFRSGLKGVAAWRGDYRGLELRRQEVPLLVGKSFYSQFGFLNLCF